MSKYLLIRKVHLRAPDAPDTPDSYRQVLCCFAEAGAEPGDHPGERIPGGSHLHPAVWFSSPSKRRRGYSGLMAAWFSVNSSTKRWEYLAGRHGRWTPIYGNFVRQLMDSFASDGALWVGPTNDTPADDGWWGLEIDLGVFLELVWFDQVKPLGPSEPSRLLGYRTALIKAQAENSQAKRH